MTLKPHIILSYSTPAPVATPILFHQNELKLFLYKRMKFILIKGNDEYKCPADGLRQLPCQICELLFMKLPCCMKRLRKSKELEL